MPRSRNRPSTRAAACASRITAVSVTSIQIRDGAMPDSATSRSIPAMVAGECRSQAEMLKDSAS